MRVRVKNGSRCRNNMVTGDFFACFVLLFARVIVQCKRLGIGDSPQSHSEAQAPSTLLWSLKAFPGFSASRGQVKEETASHVAHMAHVTAPKSRGCWDMQFAHGPKRKGKQVQ